MSHYKFSNLLVEGIIVSRPNRFIMDVIINGLHHECYCPSTGRIGNIDFRNIPCLISKSNNVEKKRTRYTVEAISLDILSKKHKSWIGINQTKVNAYIEFFLRTGQLNAIISSNKLIKREVILGKSKIDFLVDGSYLEVKSFLDTLSVPKRIKLIKISKFNSHKRFMQQYLDLSSEKNSKMILCFLYRKAALKSINLPQYNDELLNAISISTDLGVETWQVNLELNSEGVRLTKCFKLNIN